MPTDLLVRHCAPTLAGMKVGNLVSHCFDDIKTFKNEIENKNKLLNLKGIFLVILKITDRSALVYVYRKSQLAQILNNKEIRKFLAENSYENFEINDCLRTLKNHLQNKDFPHEIGVFLGYPLADIKAFIENKGANFKIVGCWKSYFNEEEASKTFERYKKCTKIYCAKLAEGFDITRLAVAV
ncbi:MAG: DUF3793 family protein [Clostridia bacterium]